MHWLHSVLGFVIIANNIVDYYCFLGRWILGIILEWRIVKVSGENIEKFVEFIIAYNFYCTKQIA